MSPQDFFVLYDIPRLSNVVWDPNTSDVHGSTGVPSSASWTIDQQADKPVPSFPMRYALEELAYQRWDGERIAQETFFYDPAQLKAQPPAG